MPEKQKKKAALISILSNSCLIVLKITAGIFSGSIGIISEALHSSIDLFASFVTFFSVSKSHKPPDENHHFGHGKYEDLAGLIEGTLIVFAAIYISYEAIQKIVHHDFLQVNADLALFAMFISIIVNISVSKYLFKIAKKTNSMALFADATHLKTDVYSSIAVFLGLFVVKITQNPIYDPMIALVVAVIIFMAGVRIWRKAKNNLLDMSLSKNEHSQIREIVGNHLNHKILELKFMRTVRTGFMKRIELTLVAEKTLQIQEARQICDTIEAEIEEALRNTDIIIQVEPND